MAEHSRRDRVDYDAWAREGWIETPDGRAVNYAFIAEWITDLRNRYQVAGMAYDRWRIEVLETEIR